MDMHEIVMKLIGQVQPIGESQVDEVRLANIKRMTYLIDDLLMEIQNASKSCESYESSVRSIGLYAKKYLTELKDWSVEDVSVPPKTARQDEQDN